MTSTTWSYMYDSDGVKSSTRDSDAEIEDSDGSRSTRASSRSSNSHSSRMQGQIQHAASVRQAQQLASNTSANSNINYQSSNTGGGSPSNGTREPCKNCKSTSHGTKWCQSPKSFEKNCGKTFASADERKAHFIQEHGFTSKPATPPLKSSLKDGKGNKVKFVKSQRLVGKVHRVQTKTPKRQQANDSEDDSDSSIGSDSSMSVEAAPRALIWRNDTTSSKKGRKVSHLRNVSTIHHSVRKSKRLSEKRDNDKPEEKASSEPEAVVTPAGQPVPAAPSTSSAQPTSSTRSRGIQQPADTAETRRRREEEYHGYSQGEPRPRFENEHKSTPHLNPRGAEFESIRLAIRIEEWYRNRTPEEELTELPAQKGILRISDTERAVQPLYLYDPEKDDTDLHFDQMIYEPRRRSIWGQRPYSLAEIIYEYDTEDEEQLDCERESQDRHHDHHTHPLAQYTLYRQDGGRRRCVLTDTGDELIYSQRQPGLQFEEGSWKEDYNYIRPGPSSIRDESYRTWYETTHPRPHTLDRAIEYWINNRRRQLQRCQANHPLSYEAFLRANQPAEGHHADETWDYGQLNRLHMIRAQAAQDFINITEHNDDGTVLLTQPKLLLKLFKEHPEKIGKRKARTPSHPYGPAPAHNATTIKEQSPLIPITTYLQLLGLLMYLTKSRPDIIMTAVSFGATKSTSPTYPD
jgi:hypothetical protein